MNSEALGERPKAIAHYRDFAKRFPSHASAADVALYIGIVHEEAGDDGPAHKAFRDYLTTFASTGKRVAEAWTRAGRTSFRLGQLVAARDELAAAKKAARAGDKAWLAEARYFEGELVLREFQAISFKDPATVGAALAKKSRLLVDAEKIYVSVASHGEPRWSVAALARTAQINDEYGDALAEAVANPPPMTPAQRKAYEDKVNGYVVTMQQKAIDLYEAAYKMALDLQLYDDTTIRIRKKLARLAPGTYSTDNEARPKLRVNSRTPAPPLVEKIERP
jgi:tetratricopeptide (TPR) repeat protein